MTSWTQRSFAGGEISPALYARADQTKHATGARTMRNFFATRYGGASNRAGFKFIREVKDSTKRVRLVKFVFNADQTYVLEFGDLYIRFYKAGAYLGYEIASPYIEADLQDLQYTQSADVIVITHRSYAPRELKRLADTNWTLTEALFAPEAARPTALTATPAGTNFYRVTYYDAETGEESLYALGAAVSISAITQANPAVVTTGAAHGYANGDEIRIAGCTGMTEVNERVFVIAGVTATTFQLQGENSTTYGAYTGSGSAYATVAKTTNTGTVSWTQPAGVTNGTYYVYKRINGVFGYIGQSYAAGSGGGSFTDATIAPQTDITPPVERKVFQGAGNWPALTTYAQQRLVFASTTNAPETVWMSQIGNYRNFSTHVPIQDDDAVTFTLAGRQVQEVRAVLEVGNMVLLTAGGEWDLAGDSDGVVRPTAINLRQRGYFGSSAIAPIVIRDSALYVQARGSQVADLQYEFATNGYKGRDLTVYAQHLVDGYQITDWDFAQIPHSVVWAVRDDGTLLGLTYVREHDVWGWHRHDTDGTFENVVVVPEGSEDVLYAVIRRTINGVQRRYIERMNTRQIDDVGRSVFVDSAWVVAGLTNEDFTGTVTVTGGTTWASDENLTLTVSNLLMLLTMSAGDQFWLYDSSGAVIKFTIISVDTATTATVQASRTVPAELRGVAQSVWKRAKLTYTGISHLEGKTLSVLADGFVHPPVTVSGGSITMQYPVVYLVAGLPYTSDLETLDLESVQGETLIDKKKRINKVTAVVQESRAVLAGPDADHLREVKLRAGEAYADPITPVTGPTEVLINGSWDDNGRVLIRNTDPLPVTVLAVIRSGMVM